MEMNPADFPSIDALVAKYRTGPKLTNSDCKKVMTLRRVGNLIAQGFGQGRNAAYIPWIRVTRRFYSPVSNIARFYVTTQARGLHLLSRLEQSAALVAAWLGAQEIREQFAMFPWQHPHPRTGLDQERDVNFPSGPGYLEIARRKNLKHGYYVGSDNVPYVATCDLVLRFGEPPDDRLVFWNVKSEDALQSSPKSSAWRRITLEQEYAREVGAHHFIYDGTAVPKLLIANLDWLAPSPSEWICALRAAERSAFAAAFVATEASQSLEQRISVSADRIGIELQRGQEAFRACAWAGQIDIDLTRAVVMSRPVVPSNKEFIKDLRHIALGEQK